MIEEIEIPIEEIHDIGEHIKLKIEKACKEAFEQYIIDNELDGKQYEFSHTVTANLIINKKL
jgi:hypothetical protein